VEEGCRQTSVQTLGQNLEIEILTRNGQRMRRGERDAFFGCDRGGRNDKEGRDQKQETQKTMHGLTPRER